jgi:hypothetical protein
MNLPIPFTPTWGNRIGDDLQKSTWVLSGDHAVTFAAVETPIVLDRQTTKSFIAEVLTK